MLFDVFDNGLYARDTSKKICAVFNAKGKSGKPLAVNPPYGYKKSETDKYLWEIDEETAPIVKSIFQLCIEGRGPLQIAKALTADKILTPTAYRQLKSTNSISIRKPYRWAESTVEKVLRRVEYLGHTVNFKTHRKSYKHKRKLDNPREEWLIFENTHGRSSHSTILSWYRKYAITSAKSKSTVRSICFREWSTARTAARKCIFAARTALKKIRST